MKLTGKQIMDLGFPEGKAVGVVMQLVENQLSDMSLESLRDLFEKVIANPETYIDDKVLGSVQRN